MSWMQTKSGKRFYPTDVPKSIFTITDIAHALSNTCRFGGHTRKFYSVAQHSFIVSVIIKRLGGSKLDQLIGLMHDVAEAYLVDVPTPVKVLLKGYKEKETEVIAEIYKQLGLPVQHAITMPAIVKRADAIALVNEARDLIEGDLSDWNFGKELAMDDLDIIPLDPGESKELFLNTYAKLMESVDLSKA